MIASMMGGAAGGGGLAGIFGQIPIVSGNMGDYVFNQADFDRLMQVYKVMID